MKELTTRQRSIFDFVQRYARERGYPPTIREIRDGFHLKSNRGVVDHLEALERKGYIRRARGSPRAIEIESGFEVSGDGERPSRGAVSYPVVGNIPAGRPEPPDGETDRTLVLDDSLFGERGDFILEVKGDSMIDDHIVPGDLIVVRKADTCENGSLVVALVDGEATVKRYVRSGTRVMLQPSNRKYRPIVLSSDASPDCMVIGEVIGVIRSISRPKGVFSG
jgi:repressor LexA